MRLKDRYKEWRIGHLRRKLETYKKQFEWAYENRELLGVDYERYTDIVAWDMMRVKRALARMGVDDETL